MELVCLALLLLLAYQQRRLIRSRRFVREIAAALAIRGKYLPKSSRSVLNTYGIDGLIAEVNQLSDTYSRFTEQNSSYHKQVDAMLSAVQEIVVIFNAEHTIEFSNRSADRFLNQGYSLKGMRLESVLRTVRLLEILDKIPDKVKASGTSSISFEHRGQTLWFELSYAKVRGIGKSKPYVTILVLHDVTELKQLQLIQREFVANVSHEFRTPLTIIKGYTDTLIEEEATGIDASARARFLDKISRNAERLHHLVEDLLILSRLESKSIPLKWSIQPFKALIQEVLADYAPRIVNSSQRMELKYSVPFESFAFDRFQMRQVLDNLVSNVFRYAASFSLLKIHVTHDAVNASIVCAVSDDGPGIAEKDLGRLFERFYRVEKGRSVEGGGTGLGLSIVKNVIELHGGTVQAKSRIGEGTCIEFTLPVSQHPISASEAGPSENSFGPKCKGTT
jgi:signal transduction histidine kinase